MNKSKAEWPFTVELIKGNVTVIQHRSYGYYNSPAIHNDDVTPVDRWARFVVRSMEKRINDPSTSPWYIRCLREDYDAFKAWVDLFDSYSE